MRVLVSGGAGYIGSHTVLALIEAGHDILVVDDFSNAKPTVVARLEALSGRHIPVHAFDLTDVDKTSHLFDTETIDAATRLLRQLDLIPIVALREIHGYPTNRIWRAIKKESLHLITGGYMTADNIDRAWMLDWHVPIGPCGVPA